MLRQLHERPALRALPRGRTLHIAAMAMIAILLVPIALGGVGIPMEAMNVGVSGPSLRRGRARSASASRIEFASLLAPLPDPKERELPVFVTDPKARELPIFMTDRKALNWSNETPPLEVFKEAYFATHVPFGAIIFREARKNDLPPELVAAMVHTESDFRAGLVSSEARQGLMQIVPSTARLLGVDDPYDPEKNIAAGTRYYRYLLDRFDDETMALAAYNAGEGNIARYGGIPPFAETRDYISKVTRRTRRYRDGFRNSYIANVRMRGDA